MSDTQPEIENRESRDRERGSALLLALMVALVMVMMGLGLAMQTFLGLQASATDRWVAKSFYAAEAGVSIQVSLLKAGSNTAPAAFVLSDDRNVPGLLGGQYTVTVDELCETRQRDLVLGTQLEKAYKRSFHIRARSNRTVNFVSGTIQSGVTGAAVEVDVAMEPVDETRLPNIPKCYE